MMRSGNLIVVSIFILTVTTSASWLSEWLRQNRDKGIIKVWYELMDPKKPESPSPIPLTGSTTPLFTSSAPNVVAPQFHTPAGQISPQVTAVSPMEPITFSALTNSPQTTTIKTSTESKASPTAAPLNAFVTEPTTDIISQMKTVFKSYWTILSVLVVLFAIFSFYCACVHCKRRNKKSLAPFHDLMSIVNKPYMYLHEHIDALKYDISFEIARSNVELGEYLGRGNFGVVYDGILKIDQQWRNHRRFKVLSNMKKQMVAVKAIGEADSPEAIVLREQILEDELKLMCRVGFHPNIVTLLGAVTAGEEKLIIMDMCSVGDLQKFLLSKRNSFIYQFKKNSSEQSLLDTELYIGSNFVMPSIYHILEPNGNWKTDLSKSITTAHLLSFAMQIARGMKYLTSMKCIHRDLAARNILLTPKGLCKIADFGLAKPIAYKEYYRTKTVKELPCRWMSVESLVDSTFTVESDIWSYGIVLYEIFTLGGYPYPFLSGNPTEAIIEGARNSQPDYCPDAIFCHMRRCWSMELERRPSFEESAALMERHLVKASSEVLSKVEKELLLEENTQKEFAELRNAAHQKRLERL